MYILIRADGYEINSWQFVTYKEAYNEMKKQYNKLTPKEWLEEEKEISFIKEYTAQLYRDEINILFIWKIQEILKEEKLKEEKINNTIYRLVLNGLKNNSITILKSHNPKIYNVFFGTERISIYIGDSITNLTNVEIAKKICSILCEHSKGEENYKSILMIEKYLKNKNVEN